MKNIDDTIDRIFNLMDHHWNAQSWRDLTGFEYAEMVCMRAKVDDISNLLKQKDGRNLEVTAKEKMILENCIIWYTGLVYGKI
jgi:hypothetical protein